MKKQNSILSTKVLTTAQSQLLKNFYFYENDFIKTKVLPFEKGSSNNVSVFTSQNAVKSISKLKFFKEEVKNVYCVGDKTADLLKQLGKNILFVGYSSRELALEIVKLEKSEVDFFCGSIRKKDLPDILHENGIRVNEYIVYETEKVSKKINSIFDGILFFSPSAVESYLLKNKAKDSVAFCIGKSTSSTAFKEFKEVFVAEETTIESVIESTLKYFN